VAAATITTLEPPIHATSLPIAIPLTLTLTLTLQMIEAEATIPAIQIGSGS
jgi:hypothetical protein